jgi:hypothetical protein
MKKILLICSLFLLGTITTKATSLNAGDIAISSINSDDTDNFSFVLLTPISGTTTIYFTDNGWDDDADGAAANPTWRGTTEGTITWTFTGALPCGTEIQILTPSSTVAASQGTPTKSGSFNLAATADHLLAYTGTGVPLDGTEITNFITAFGLGTAGWTPDASTTGTSALPPGLTDGGNAIATLNGSDNFQYDCSTLSPVAALRTALVTVGNYTSGTTNENYLAPACVYSCGTVCVNPDLPTSLIANSSIICSGSNSILSWIGNLNDATQWSIYTNSCGGTLVGTSATNSFTTGALTSTTIFYIRGEDGAGCVDESTGLCAFVTVSVNALPTTPSAINPLTVCPSEDVILTATGSGTGDIVFYDNTEVEIQRNTMGGTATQTFNTGALTNGNYTFYVAEDNGTCQSLYDTLNVFVGDTVSPTVVCQPATVYLDNSGLAILFPSDIDGGSSDNCGSVNLATSIQTFTCNELGANNVTLFGDDGYGNVDSCSTLVTVLDTIIPLVSCQNISVFLDASGLAIISANDIDNGSADNCGGITLNSSIQTFTCNEIGTNQVMLYASDASNNIDSCMALVIVLDTISPVINCLGDQTDLATASCQFTVPDYTAAATVFATDNCSALPTITQTPIAGSLVGLGASTITLTADDGNGNTSSCNFTLTVSSSASGTLGTTICNGDSFMFNGTLYNGSNTSGVETITGAAANGCDSIVTVTVIVVPSPDVTVTNASPTLTANQTGATYQWLDCDNGNAIIPTATNQAFTPSTDGNYAVEITLGGCVDTSACENVSTVGVNETNLSKGFNIYPNPTKGLFTVSLDELDNNSTIIVYSIVGKEVINQKITNNKTIINLEGFDKGIYFVKIQNGNQLITERIIKQ